MAYRSLTDFITALEKAGELRRISQPVATELQITEIANREMKQPGGGKALLFEHPTINGKPSAFPLAINVLGSRRRVAMALNLDSVDQLSAQVEFIMKAKPPKTFRDALKLLRQGFDLIHARPHHVKKAPCQEVVHDLRDFSLEEAENSFSLLNLPILHCWPHDGGRYITLPNVYTKDPESGEGNIGMYRMQVYDGKNTGMHWQVHKVAARHGKQYYERGEPMPVAVALGGDPVFNLAATAPLPDGINELLFAGFARKRSVALTTCKTIPIEVPAESDFVLEGYVTPGELRPEGPFGDHTGFYTPIDNYPIFHLTAITHRKEAVYPATIVGIPPMEDFYIGEASVKIFLPIFKMNFPEIVDIALPAEGIFHNFVFVSIKKQYPWQAFKVMHGLWGMGQMMFTKYIVVVDEDCDVHNTSEVLFRLGANTDPARDTSCIKNPSDSLDHAPTIPNLGSHMGFDATRKLPGEGYHRDWPELVKMNEETIAWADQFLRKER